MLWKESSNFKPKGHKQKQIDHLKQESTINQAQGHHRNLQVVKVDFRKLQKDSEKIRDHLLVIRSQPNLLNQQFNQRSSLPPDLKKPL